MGRQRPVPAGIIQRMNDRWVWLSTERMTVVVRVDDDGIIKVTPPIVRKFLGQPVDNLIGWMKQQPGFEIVHQH